MPSREGYTPASSPILLPVLSPLPRHPFSFNKLTNITALRGGSKKRICNRGSISILRICPLPSSHSPLSLLLLELRVSFNCPLGYDRLFRWRFFTDGWYASRQFFSMCVCVVCVGYWPRCFVLCFSNKVFVVYRAGNFGRLIIRFLEN